jgi:hypothetical protein
VKETEKERRSNQERESVKGRKGNLKERNTRNLFFSPDVSVINGNLYEVNK